MGGKGDSGEGGDKGLQIQKLHKNVRGAQVLFNFVQRKSSFPANYSLKCAYRTILRCGMRNA
jgi:hypothetical protein